MAAKDTATFFSQGTNKQFEEVLALYPKALRLKAEQKSKKPDELVKLDNWYQNELPKRIKARGKDAHMVHDELVQTMKWKQSRGKFYPQLSYLVKVNTPRAVVQETKKAFRKLPNVEQAINALSNLKGVGTTMASALCAAACPESAPFMADECLMAIPEIEGIDYTTKEYLNFVNHIQAVVERLNKNKGPDDTITWSPHKVELAVWTYYIICDHKPELLSTVPGLQNGTTTLHANGDSLDAATTSDESNQGPTLNGKSMEPPAAPTTAATTIIDEDTTTSFTEDSLDKAPTTPITAASEVTNDSIVSAEDEEVGDEEEEETTNDSLPNNDENAVLPKFNNKRPIEDEDAVDGIESEKKKCKADGDGDDEKK